MYICIYIYMYIYMHIYIHIGMIVPREVNGLLLGFLSLEHFGGKAAGDWGEGGQGFMGSGLRGFGV